MSRLRNERRIDLQTTAHAIQKNEVAARSILERLVEAGLIEPQGIKKGRTYTLSAKIYRDLGQRADYVRQVGFDRIQQEQMVIQYAQKHGRVTRKEVMDLCHLSPDQSSHLLHRLVAEHRLIRHGRNKGSYYTFS